MVINSYQQTIDYLYKQLPMFQRIGPPAFKKDLTNTFELCEALGNPHKKLCYIHIAGTNGKGSVAHMLSAILQYKGYTTGLYTSPHLKDFKERIRVNNKKITEKEVLHFVQNNMKYIEKINPSFFEITVVMALEHFVKQQVDIAIIETGMGGRLDSTNVITPLLSIITNITLDHTQFLGDTLKEIAVEKAGIIKPYIPIVIGESHPETREIFINKAKEQNANIYFTDKDLRASNAISDNQSIIVDVYKEDILEYKNLQIGLGGLYEVENALTVIKSIEILNNKGFKIKQAEIIQGLKQIRSLSNIRGKWEVLSNNPLVIADCAHNIAGIKKAFQQIKLIKHNKLHIVFGMVKDKDITNILELLPKDAVYYFCKADIPRALSEKELQHMSCKYSLEGSTYLSVNHAIKKAVRYTKTGDLVFIGGSSFVVAEAVSDSDYFTKQVKI